MTEKEFLDPVTVREKEKLQRIYKSQNAANDYPEATRGLNVFNYVMADAHTTSRFGSLELYLDMKPLISDTRFSSVSPADYGGGLLMLTQMIRTGGLVESEIGHVSSERMLTVLCDVAIP